MNSPRDILYSVVVPVYNEEENLHELNNRLVSVLEKWGRYEVLYVNDGSNDNSGAIINEFCAASPMIKTIAFSRNFGHQAALTAGLNYTQGDAVAVIDADLQDPPEVLPEFFQKWQDGYEVVYAIRKHRQEGWFKKCAYFLFYRLLKGLAEIDIPLDSGDFCVMDRVIVDKLNTLPERHRFIRGIRAWLGFRQVGITYHRHARFAGTPKYNLRRRRALAYDGLFAFSKKPLTLALRLGVIVTATSFGFIAFTLWRKLFQGVQPEGWTSLMIAVMFMGGVQLLMMGVLGEYIGRIFDEVKGRPIYIIADTKNIP